MTANRVFELSFQKLDKPSARISFPAPGTLSKQLSRLADPQSLSKTLPHESSSLLASASVEMWHRAIHSFLWSVALTSVSPLWSSVSGYYSSHFVMRALAHAMGFFKSFRQRKVIQVVLKDGHFLCSSLEPKDNGEHAFYWKVIKSHPDFAQNILFRENNERDQRSDSAHRNFANYTDHVNSYIPLAFPKMEEIGTNVEKISRIRLYSVTETSREDYPDLFNVQILAFQRIVAFQDYLDRRVPNNRFWRAHRRPTWCKEVMLYSVEDTGLEAPLVA